MCQRSQLRASQQVAQTVRSLTLGASRAHEASALTIGQRGFIIMMILRKPAPEPTA